jgi:hypothetical protein
MSISYQSASEPFKLGAFTARANIVLPDVRVERACSRLSRTAPTHSWASSLPDPHLGSDSREHTWGRFAAAASFSVSKMPAQSLSGAGITRHTILAMPGSIHGSELRNFLSDARRPLQRVVKYLVRQPRERPADTSGLMPARPLSRADKVLRPIVHHVNAAHSGTRRVTSITFRVGTRQNLTTTRFQHSLKRTYPAPL